MNELKEELRKFAEAMNKEYNKDNLLKEFCTIKEFNGEKKEFIQVGERINLPKEFFEKEEGVHKDNTILASDFVRSLVNGEKDFILKEIIKSEKVSKFNLSEFSYAKLCDTILKLKEATHIFLPLDPFFKKIHYMAFEAQDKIKFIPDVGPVIIVDGRKIKIDWITSHMGIDEIIIINKEQLKIIQKIFDNPDAPKGMKTIKEYDEFSKGNKLMLYFGDKDEKEFDFILRTVISKPEPTENTALVVSFKETSEND